MEHILLNSNGNPIVRFVHVRDSLEKLRKAKILVIDDNKDAVEVLSLLLEMEGFDVVTSHNGLDALNRMKNDGGISVILLDLWMPVMNGSEFLRQKAGTEAIANIPVVVLSANPPWDRPEGVWAVLQKPVYAEGLVKAIERCLT